MIRRNDIKLWITDKTLGEQIDELSEGEYSLINPSKWEEKRRKIRNEYVTGKIGIKEYTKNANLLIDNVLDNIIKNEVFSSEDELPFWKGW